MTARQWMLMGVLAVGVGVTGCPAPMGTCEQDSDCATGGVCDSTCNCCIFPTEEEECSPACQPWEQCTGNTCAARYTGIAITSHSNGAHVKTGASAVIAALPTLAEGKSERGTAAVTLKVTAPDAAVTEHSMAWNGSAYEVAVTFGVPGEYQVVASVGAFNSDAVVLVSDNVGPSFSVTIDPAPTRPIAKDGTDWKDTEVDYQSAYRRDEEATVYVSSPDGDVDTSSVEVSVSIAGGAAKKYPVSAASGCGGNPAWCGSAKIPLWEPEMKAFRGEFSVSATGADSAGNAGTAATPDTDKVTRWKWAHQVPSAETFGAPAIGENGRVVFGFKATLGGGGIVALNHDGTIDWSNNEGAVVTGISIGKAVGGSQAVYAAIQKTVGTGLYAFDLVDNGTPIQSFCPPPTATSEPASAVGVSHTLFDEENQPVETASAVFGSYIVSLRRNGAPTCRDVSVGGNAGAGASISSRGSAIFIADSDAKIRAYDFLGSGWTQRTAGWPFALATTAGALAQSENLIVSAGAPGQEQGGVFTVDPMDPSSVPWRAKGLSGAKYPVVGSGGTVFAPLNDASLLRTEIGSTTYPTVPRTNVLEGAPALGEDDRIYTVDLDGELVVARQSAPNQRDWVMSGLNTVKTSPSLDCGRNADGSIQEGGRGVLYVLNSKGRLFAIIVDSRGIDTSAPWPKYQRDPRNTGNADTVMSEFNCD